jgi:hypothetical protein
LRSGETGCRIAARRCPVRHADRHLPGDGPLSTTTLGTFKDCLVTGA